MRDRSFHIDRGVRKMRAGGVIAYPTEGIWGLGCDPFSATAVARLLEIKARPVRKGLILVAGNIDQVAPLLDQLDDRTRADVLASWPGPVTWILPAPIGMPRWITGETSGVAVRLSAHPMVADLCVAYGGLIVSTSANPGGRAPARTELMVRRYFGRGLDFVLAGELGGQRGPSEIRDARTRRIIRAG